MTQKKMATKKETEEIKAQNEEIQYLKTKAYQLITTNKSLKKELDQVNSKTKSPECSRKNVQNECNIKTAKSTNQNGAEKRIDALNEEIHYLKTKIYQLIATNKTLKKELNNARNKEKNDSNGWKKIHRRKHNGERTHKPSIHKAQRSIPLRNRF